MSETTEPAPLTEREMRQFVTLAALPTLERALERLRWLEAQRAGLTNPTTIMVRIDEGWITPSDAVREIMRLRDELIAAQGYRAAFAEVATRRGEMVDALIAERDEARREYCEARADPWAKPTSPEVIAANRGWDCFDPKEER
jgi:hypothetical protein